jgi:hypothetical protein
MKTAKLKNGLICVSVPNKWERFYIDTVKSIGYFENNILGFFDPNILMLPHIQILGTITKDECSFDLTPYIKSWDFMEFEGFKSMIENETEFLFGNPHKKPKAEDYANQDVRDMWIKKDLEEWQQHQSRVIEKLLILKTI